MQVKTIRNDEYCIIAINEGDTEVMALAEAIAESDQDGIVKLTKYVSLKFPEVKVFLDKFRGTQIKVALRQVTKHTYELIIAKNMALLTEIVKGHPQWDNKITVEFISDEHDKAAYIQIPRHNRASVMFDLCFKEHKNLASLFNAFMHTELEEKDSSRIDAFFNPYDEGQILVNRTCQGYEFIIAKNMRTALHVAELKNMNMQYTQESVSEEATASKYMFLKFDSLDQMILFAKMFDFTCNFYKEDNYYFTILSGETEYPLSAICEFATAEEDIYLTKQELNARIAAASYIGKKDFLAKL